MNDTVSDNESRQQFHVISNDSHQINQSQYAGKLLVNRRLGYHLCSLITQIFLQNVLLQQKGEQLISYFEMQRVSEDFIYAKICDAGTFATKQVAGLNDN